jgi:hypothetical protein
MDEFLGQAVGKVVTLRPQPSNEVDALAIRAYDWTGRHVGYVAKAELPTAWNILRSLGRHSVRGRAAVVDTEHHCVVVECVAEVSDEPAELYPRADFLSWNYDGPVLPKTDEQERLEYLMDEIEDRLEEYDGWNDDDMYDFFQLVQRFIELSKFDLSAEMSDYRVRLADTLRSKGIDDLSGELDREASHAGRESRCGEVLEYWMKMLSKHDIARRMMVHADEYNRELVKQQLESFPQGMYQEWLADRQYFVSRLLYNHIPREVLWNFVSGIVYVSLTETQSEDTHKQPQQLSAPTSISVNINTGTIGAAAKDSAPKKNVAEQEVRELLQSLLKAPAEDGSGALMTDKGQWWAVYRVLNECCNYPKKMADFFQLMKSWQMDQATPSCTYDSLRAAQKSVPKLSAKVTLWNQFRDLSDVYRKQCEVAAFLLQKLGFTD